MRSRIAHGLTFLLASTVGLACATSSAPPPPQPALSAPGSEPVPPPSAKKGVVVPADVKLGSGPADGTPTTGTAGPAVGPRTGSPPGPN